MRVRVCACGSDPTDKENSFVQLMETRPEGFKHLSLDGSPGVVEALAEAGVRTRTTDPQHCDLHMETITGCTEQLFQLNPVGMGTSRALLLLLLLLLLLCSALLCLLSWTGLAIWRLPSLP